MRQDEVGGGKIKGGGVRSGGVRWCCVGRSQIK